MKRKYCKLCLAPQVVPHNKVACRSCGKRHGFMDVAPERVNTAQLRQEAASSATFVKVVSQCIVPVLVTGRWENKVHDQAPDYLAEFNAGKAVKLVHRRPGVHRKLHHDQVDLRKAANRPYGRLLLNWILWRRAHGSVTAFAEEIGSKRTTVVRWIKTGYARSGRAHSIMDMMIQDGTLPALLNKQTMARWRAYQEATCQTDSETSRSSSGSGGYGKEESSGSARQRSIRRSQSQKSSTRSTDSPS